MTAHRYLSGRALVCDDNLNALRELPNSCVDLVYLDPPFNSNAFYVAAFGDKGLVNQQLRDVWRWTDASQRALNNLPPSPLRDCIEGVRLQAGKQSSMAAYILYMGVRLQEMRRVLKPSGSIYLHCDPHANAYLRVLMDVVFGTANFRNEIVWHYGKWSNSAGYFQRNHDTILFYSQSRAYTFNRMFTMSADKQRKLAIGYQVNRPGGVKQLIVYDRAKAAAKIAEGDYDRIVYMDNEPSGSVLHDTWNDINIINSQSKERVGYPTQKPLALLERIISASSNPDIVLDPFCGCGTAADAAASLGRAYLGIDISGIAVRVMQQRLESRGDSPDIYGLGWDEITWATFEKLALRSREESEDGVPAGLGPKTASPQ